MRFLNMWRRKEGIERATPEIAKQHLEETLAREEVVRSIVQRNSKKRVENHLGVRVHKALGGIR